MIKKYMKLRGKQNLFFIKIKIIKNNNIIDIF